MILTAHQPCYMPWLGYFAKIAKADKFCIFDCVPFSRHDYTNRVQIKTKDGAQWLTVPVEHTGERQLLKDVRIASGPWQRKNLRAIECAYSKAPHFERYWAELPAIMGAAADCTMLADCTRTLFLWCMEKLGLSNKPITLASNYDFKGEKSALVLDMCRQLGASQYIFGTKGRDYADVEAFGREGVLVQFQDYQHPVYPQLHGEFVPGLSVVDLLMNCGPDSLDVLMGRA